MPFLARFSGRLSLYAILAPHAADPLIDIHLICCFIEKSRILWRNRAPLQFIIKYPNCKSPFRNIW